MSGQKDSTLSGEGEEEETKESSPGEPTTTTTSPSCSSGGDGGGLTRRRTGQDSDIDERAAGIPEEIKNNQYASERELLIDLEKFGLDDRRIILNHDGFPIGRDMLAIRTSKR
jgi:hypothetical protein